MRQLHMHRGVRWGILVKFTINLKPKVLWLYIHKCIFATFLCSFRMRSLQHTRPDSPASKQIAIFKQKLSAANHHTCVNFPMFNRWHLLVHVLSAIQKLKKCHDDSPPFNMALKAPFAFHLQWGPSLIVITYGTLQEKVSIAGFEHMLLCCSVTTEVSSAATLSPLLLSAPNLLDKFITSGPQERPDFNSHAHCSIALHGRSCLEWGQLIMLYHHYAYFI